MKTLFKLFIVGIFSIISTSLFSQINNIHSVKQAVIVFINHNNGKIALFDESDQSSFEAPKNKNADFELGTIVYYKIITPPNGQRIEIIILGKKND